MLEFVSMTCMNCISEAVQEFFIVSVFRGKIACFEYDP